MFKSGEPWFEIVSRRMCLMYMYCNIHVENFV